jgi:hypothetical protein
MVVCWIGKGKVYTPLHPQSAILNFKVLPGRGLAGCHRFYGTGCAGAHPIFSREIFEKLSAVSIGKMSDLFGGVGSPDTDKFFQGFFYQHIHL